jgi:hypothetical protein
MSNLDIDSVLEKHRINMLERQQRNAEFKESSRRHDLKMQLISIEMQRIISVMNAPLHDLIRDIKNS